MQPKKNPNADLARYSGIFLQIGFAIALLLVLGAFSITTKDKGLNTLGQLDELVLEEEIMPITRQEQIQPPPPPEPPAVSEVLNIVEDDVDIDEDDELVIEDTEADQETAIQIVAIDEEEEEQEAQVFYIVEQIPEFPGGDLELRKYIANNIEYPEIAKENGIQGRIFIQFVVNKDGKVERAKIVRGIDPSLDKEALRVINSLPKWKAGSQRGKPVNVSYTVPINFQLN